MGLKGSPELPGDSEDALRTSGTHITNYGANVSDDSDVDEEFSHAGYEPLPLGDIGEDLDQDNSLGLSYSEDSNLPTVISTDAEIEREVWSQPRPQELEIQLDNTRAQQIMSAMESISLPSSAIPEWAQGVPEELWKQNLLERIRQRKEVTRQGNNRDVS